MSGNEEILARHHIGGKMDFVKCLTDTGCQECDSPHTVVKWAEVPGIGIRTCPLCNWSVEV